jgi:hypothetical protein
MGNSGEQARDRTQSRVILSANLTRVNEAAKRSRQTRFTALLHHVDVAALVRRPSFDIYEQSTHPEML